MLKWIMENWELVLIFIALLLLPRRFVTSHIWETLLAMAALGVFLSVAQWTIRQRKIR